MTDAPPNSAAGFQIFISYSREDIAFVSELEAGLKLLGFDVFIDRQLSGGEEWWKSLRQQIAQADTIIFVLTPNSAGSAMCLKELDEAVWLSKRVLPVVPVQLGETRVPERLSALQYIFFTPERSFVTALGELRDALEKNLEWISEHTRYADMARRWKEGEKDSSLLLTGQSLAEAKTWQKDWTSPNPEPTVEIIEYVSESESAEAVRLDQDRQELAERERLAQKAANASRRLTRGLVVFSLVAMALAAVAGWAGYQSLQQKSRAVAEAQRARAAEAQSQAEAKRAKTAEAQAETEAKRARAAEKHAENVAEEAKTNKQLAEKEAIRAKTAEERITRLLGTVLKNLPAKWPEDHASSDYRHVSRLKLAEQVGGKSFTIDQTVIEKLLELNFFDPQAMGKKIFVGLRGAQIDSMQLNKSRIELRDTRPDYRTFRTVFIVLDRETGLMSAFVGSSVPAMEYMRRKFAQHAGNEGSFGFNMLPAGMYLYRKNAHSRGRVNPALRMTDRDQTTADGEVTVLRTNNDLIFGIDDWWHRTMPYDNLHVSYFADRFSSAGSLTIRGRHVDDLDYKEFAAVLRHVPWNTPVDVCLLTGLEAAIVSKTLASPPEVRPEVDLRRLRQGSSGEYVAKLQRALGFSSENAFFGPATAKRFAELQQERLGWADGIYSPEMDDLLGLGIFKKRTGAEPPPNNGDDPEAGRPETVAIRAEDLLKFAPRASAAKFREALVEHGPEILGKYGITSSPLRFAHFMAQVGHESGGFTIDTESLNYTTARRLMQVWPTKFPTVESATPFLRNEKKLANAVYGGRVGNVEPDDGYRFRGRGLIQITGRDAYEAVNPLLGEGTDIVENPDLAADPALAVEIAAILWTQRGLNQYADANNIKRITFRIIGGFTGLESRRTSFANAWAIWGNGRTLPQPKTDKATQEQ